VWDFFEIGEVRRREYWPQHNARRRRSLVCWDPSTLGLGRSSDAVDARGRVDLADFATPQLSEGGECWCWRTSRRSGMIHIRANNA
jgi:hypothetical protein